MTRPATPFSRAGGIHTALPWVQGHCKAFTRACKTALAKGGAR